MSFLNLNKRFSSAAELAAYLGTLPAPSWGVIGSTYHNTYVPNESQWRGHASMLSMQQSYVAKGWSTGPHLYLAVGTAFDGIYLMCPPTQPAIHAGACNANRFGVEVVGDFQARPMAPAQLALLVDVLAELHRWARLGPNVVAHRDCMPERTCPGAAAYAQKPEVQRLLAQRLAPAPWIVAWQANGVPAPPPEQHGWAIPKAYQRNYRRLGACREPEQYSEGGAVSVACFEHGQLVYQVTTAAVAIVYRAEA